MLGEMHNLQMIKSEFVRYLYDGDEYKTLSDCDQTDECIHDHLTL